MLKGRSFQDMRMVNVLHKNIFHKDTRLFYLNMQPLKYPQKYSFNVFARRVKRVVCTSFSVWMQLSCSPVMSSYALLRTESKFYWN